MGRYVQDSRFAPGRFVHSAQWVIRNGRVARCALQPLLHGVPARHACSNVYNAVLVDAQLPIPGISASVRRATPWGSFLAREIVLILAGTVLLALTARISVPLPFSPVPLSGQTLGVLLIGVLYGPWRAAATVLLYLAEGLAGLPVFSLGRSGPLMLLGPTGGYLVGFVPAAWIAGLAIARPPVVRLAVLLLASAVVYAFGAPWLAVVGSMSIDRALTAGVIPFLPGDVLKAGLAAAVAPSGSALLAPFLGRGNR